MSANLLRKAGLVLLSFAGISHTFRLSKSTHQARITRESQSSRLYAASPYQEWNDDGHGVGEFSENKEAAKISKDILSVFELDLGAIATSCAIKTQSYYMLEFHDEVNQRWMENFANYSKNGFPGGDWYTYLEDMITLDNQVVEVFMRPPKNFRRGDKHSNAGNNVLLKYDHEIEPRKIAHSLLSVRENVCEEIVEDISSMKAEHDEALRYARTLMKSGKEAAEKGRRETRYHGGGTSTPHRNRNFHDVSALITFAALDAMRIDLKKRRDTLSLEILDDMMQRMTKDNQSRSPSEISVFTRNAPRFIIEDLCRRGVMDGIVEKGGRTVNILTLAESLMAKRVALATRASGILRTQNLDMRRYYKMIKDYGGFKKFNLRERANIEIVDMDERARKEKELLASEQKKIGEDEEADTGLDAMEKTSMSAAVSSSGGPQEVLMEQTAGEASPVPEEDDINLLDTDFNDVKPMLM